MILQATHYISFPVTIPFCIGYSTLFCDTFTDLILSFIYHDDSAIHSPMTPSEYHFHSIGDALLTDTIYYLPPHSTIQADLSDYWYSDSRSRVTCGR